MIGKHECKEARNTGLKEALAILLDEALTALEEAVYDLNDEQTRAFPIPGRNNIAWIVMHTLQNLDQYANRFQLGKHSYEHQRRWDLWECRPAEKPRPGDPFPSQKDMVETLNAVRKAAEQGLAAATDNDLRSPRNAEDWWRKTAADAYMRTICHTMAHVRQIWLLRGALGLTDGKSWPRKHWA
jgi:hypothetical protein